VGSCLEWCGFDEYLSKEERDHRLKIREILEEEIAPKVDKFIHTTEFPYEFVETLKKLKINGTINKGHGAPGLSPMMMAAAFIELFRIDASVATFFLVHNSLGIDALFLTASEEQLKKYIPPALNFEKILCFGLTEKDFGSDATSLSTNVNKTKGGYYLNGNKRWIGNASHADYVICWAQGASRKGIEGFVVDLKSKGVTVEKIEGKYSLRSVQNCNIFFDNVFVPEECRLEKTQDFASGAGKVLKHSRVNVCWAAVGIAVGAYDRCMAYISKRRQFGKTISSFQLSQEKVARMMGNIQGMVHYASRITLMYYEGKTTMGQIALCKAWCTLRGREVVALARELCGGNGIILENGVMKSFIDMESIYTYEGTYDINSLVAGRELTGKAAFK
jgi:acyl-CoA oxidase